MACGKKTEVFSRVVGYHRPVRDWNKGKKEEFKGRVAFDGGAQVPDTATGVTQQNVCEHSQ